MHYTKNLDLKGYLAGFSGAAARPGETLPLIVRDMLFSEDGEALIGCLTEITKLFLEKDPTSSHWIAESRISTLIIIMHRDNVADIYINEPRLISQCQVKRDFKAGEPVKIDDIADLSEAYFEGLSIPDDAGYIVLLSHGWRRGLLYDFASLNAEVEILERDVPKLLAEMVAYMMFQGHFQSKEEEWSRLYAERWFPFMGLSGKLIERMFLYAREEWAVDELLPEIASETKASIPELRKLAQEKSQFRAHTRVLMGALDAYERGEFAIVVSALHPRIEGILRNEVTKMGVKPQQEAIIAAATYDPISRRHGNSPLLPARFDRYLNECIFAFESFEDPSKVEKVTRHSIAHGVAPQDKLDEKEATLAVLILRQLSFFLYS